MKAYVATTGVLFLLLTVVHVLRAFQETQMARDPWFILTTVLSAGLAIWALRVFRRTRRLPPTP